MGVAVHGRRDGGVAEVELGGSGVGAGCGEEAGAGVPEVVNPQTLRQLCRRDGLAPDLLSEVAVAQRRTVRCREHESFGIVGYVTVDVLCEEVAEESGDGHDATAMVLRWPEVLVLRSQVMRRRQTLSRRTRTRTAGNCWSMAMTIT